MFNTEPEILIRKLKHTLSHGVTVKSRLKGSEFHKLLLTLIVLISGVLISSGQTNYYSKSAANLNNLATWGTNPDGSGTTPASFNAPDQIFNIRNNASKTIDNSWTVSGAGSRVIIGDATNPCVFTVPAAYVFNATTTISNNGTLRISSTAGTPYVGTLTVNSGGTYEHAKDGGSIPTATWAPASNCNITGITGSTGLTGGLEGQTFGHFTWNCPLQTSNFYLAANFAVAGNFTVSGTGSFSSSGHVLRMSEFATSYTISVAGNFVIDNTSTFKMNNGSGACTLNVGGDFTIYNGSYFTIVTGNASSTLSVTGHVNILGTLDMQEESSMTGTLNVGGNLTLAGSGLIQESATGLGVINFIGNTTQTYLKTGGTISNNINFNVNNGSILDVGTSLIDGSDGNFTLNAGTGIITANDDGLSSTPGLGSIQVNGSITLNSGADYTYNGSNAQVTGDALPVTIRNFTINNANGVTNSQALTITGSYSSNGQFSSASDITFNGTTVCGGSIYATAGTITYSNTALNIIAGTYNNLIKAGASTATLCGATTVNGTLTLSGGIMSLGSYTLTISTSGRVSCTGTGVIDSNAGSSFTINSNAPTRFPDGNYQNVTINSTGAITLCGNTTINNTLTLTSGSFNVSNRTLTLNGPTITGNPSQLLTTNLSSLIFGGTSSGVLIPASVTALNNLSISNTNVVSLQSSPTIYGTFDPQGAGLSIGAHSLTLNGQINCGSLSGGTSSNLIIGGAGTSSLSSVVLNDFILDRASGVTLCGDVTVDGTLNLINGCINLNGHTLTTNIVIEANPPVAICQNITVSLDATGNVTITPAQVDNGSTVNCGSPILSLNRTAFTCADIGVQNVTLTVSDIYGVQATCNASVTITDEQNPTITCPANVVNIPADAGECYATGVALGTPVTGDNCGVSTVTNNAPVQFPVGTTVVTWTVTDVNGRTATCNQNVTVVDLQNPTVTAGTNVVTTTSADGTGNCTVAVAVPAAVFGDNCSSTLTWAMTGAVSASGSGQVGTYTFPIGLTTITYTNTDGASLTASSVQTVTVTDNEAPTVTAGTNVVTTTSADGTGNCTVAVAVPAAVFGDNCSSTLTWAMTGAVSASGSGQVGTYTFPIGLTTITYTNTDGASLTASSVQTVTVTDNEAPTVTAGTNVVTTTSADGTGNCTVAVAVPAAVFGDNCSSTLTWAMTGAVSASGSGQVGTYTFPIGVTTITYTNTDGASLTASSVQNVTVTDNENPTIACPTAVVNIPADAGECYATGVALGTPVTGDNCGVSTVMNNAPVQFPVGTTVVTWTVTDVNGRTATCNQNVTVVDLQNPTVTAGTNVVTTTSADGTGNCTVAVAVPAAVFGDNCSSTLTWAMTGAVSASGSGQVGTYTFPIGLTTITYTNTDGASLTASSVQTVTVTDNEAPTVTAGTNVVTTTSADGTGNCTVAVAVPAAVFGDNCSSTLTWAMTGAVSASGSGQVGTYTFPIGLTTITYTNTDGASLTASSVQTVTVTDNEAPTVTAGTNVVTTTSADGTGNCTVAVAVPAAVFGDNCSSTLTWAMTGAVSASGSGQVGTYTFPIGVTTITYTNTDGASLTASSVQNVTVTDNENPTIACPTAVVNIPADAGECYATGVALGTPVTGDNCGVSTVTNNAPVQFPVGTTVVTWTVTDVNGRTATCNQNVTVVDLQNPTVTAGTNVVTTTSADGTGNCTVAVAVPAAVFGDNCSSTLTWAMTGAVSASGSGQVGTYTFPIGLTTITYTNTDGASLTASSVQTVTVTDNEAPTVTAGTNVVTTTSADGTGNCTVAVAVPAAVFGDNCSSTLTWAMTGAVSASGSGQVGTYTFPIGLTTITYTNTDGASLTASSVQTVTVTDNEAPTVTAGTNVVTTTSADGTGNCTVAVAVPAAVFGDNCSSTLTWAMTGAVSASGSGQVGTYTFPIGLTTITYTNTDGASLTASSVQTVTVADNENPTIACPTAVVNIPADAGECYATGVALGTPVTGDNCGVSTVTNNAPVQFPVGTTVVTWTVTDVNGRTATCNQNVTVVDLQNPTVTAGTNVVTTTSADGTGNCTVAVAVPAAVFGDNCSSTLTWAMTGAVSASGSGQVGTYTFPIGLTTITYTNTDGASLTASSVQTVTVTDNEAPTVTAGTNVVTTTSADGTGNCTVAVAVPAAVFGDNCSSTLTWAMTGAVSASGSGQVGTYTFPIGLTTITYTNTDGASLTASSVQTVTVTDNEAPTVTAGTNVVTTTSADGTGNCTVAVAVPAAVFGDNCSSTLTWAMTGAVSASGSGQVGTYTFPIGLTTITYTNTDGASLTASSVQTVTVTDNEAPTVTAGTNVVTTTSADGTGNCTVAVAVPAAVFGDNCSSTLTWAMTGAVSASGSGQVGTYTFPIGVTTITYTNTDGASLTASSVQTVTVTDNEAPTVTAGTNVVTTTSADGTGNCTVAVAVPAAVFGDNCSSTLTWAMTGAVSASGSGQVGTYTFPIGLTTITYTNTDGASLTASSVQTVTVTDNEAPTVTAGTNVVTTTSADGTGNCTVAVAVPAAVFGDNCSSTLTWAMTGAVSASGSGQVGTYTFPIGVTTITYTNTDGASLTASSVQTVTVTDNEAPTVTAGTNVVTTTSADGTGNCTVAVAVPAAVFGDNCSSTLTWAMTGAVSASGSGQVGTYTFPIGLTTITYTNTDGASLTASSVQTVTVTDNEAPTVTAGTNVVTTTSADGTGNCTVAVAVPAAVFGDNCSSTLTWAMTGAVSASGSGQVGTYTFPIGVTTITYTNTDGASLTASSVQTVTVTDNEAPTVTAGTNVVTTTSADGTGNCTVAVAVPAAVFGDNCSSTLTWAMTGAVSASGSGQVGTYTFPIGLTTITYTNTDGASLTASSVQTVTVTDNEAPTVTAGTNVVTTTSADGTGNCTVAVAVPAAVFGDNCSSTLTWAMTGAVSASGSGQVGTYTFPIGVTTITYTNTDGASLTASSVQNVTVTDNENPTIACPTAVVNIPADAGECYATGVALGTPVTGDNCGVSTVMNNAPVQFPVGTTVVTWTVTDVNGRTATCNQNVTIIDLQNPTITCPANVVTTTSADATGNCTTTATLGSPVTGDNCSVSGVVAQVGGFTINPVTYAFPIGLTTVTWIVTDGSGNTASCNQTVTVTDNENPTITCPANVTISCEADNTPTGTGTATATDNCAPTGNIVITSSDVSTYSADPANILHYNYVITRTWRATDVAGNFSTCDQTITVQDITKPAIVCPANVTISCEADNTPTGTGTATATDNCAPTGNIVITSSDVSTYSADPANILHYNYVITRTWRATDVAGNFSTCDQTITVQDITKPAIVCPANVTISCEADNTPTGTGTATATDNCAPTGNIVITSSDVSTYSADPANILHYNYVITRTWRATDVAGNFSTCDQTITVQDITKPAIVCPANVTISCEADNTPTGTGTATATDNCAPTGNIVITSSDVSTYSADPANILHYNYVITRTWRATDVAGNFSTCDQTITVQDITKPAIVCPANVTISCEADNTPTGTGTATATDNCAPTGNIVITSSDVSTYSADPANILHYNYVITRTWRATDVAGNFSTCDQTITVQDITKPAIVCPANVTISCEADNTPTGTGTATATDNCAPTGNIVITSSDVSTYSADPANILHYNYVITRTWRATDVAGNFSTCDQTITVQDITKPAIVCPANVTISCEADNTPTGTGTATATDNCAPTGNIVITSSDVSTYSADPANILHYNYVITRTWRATDVAGNFSTCDQTITVQDITKPAIVCPANVTISCEADNTPTGTGTATATDNCAPTGNIVITSSDVSTYSADPANILHYNYVITRTWRATDVAGNFSTCDQTITVQDITKPAIVCPANVTISCEADNTPTGTGTATATDNCAPTGNIVITSSDVSTYSADPANILHYNYVITRTWRATDVAGNFSTCDQTITVQDITKPAIVCPANVTISCEADNTPTGTGTATATDNCAPTGNIVITSSDVSTYSADPANILHYNYVITRTWRATDVAGNFSTCDQTITVQDITKPAIVCPANVTISCEADNTPTGTGTATATDNCAPTGNIVITSSDVSTYSADPANILHYNYVITRTWRATDVAGNFSTCDQTITVQDITKPAIVCPANVTISCEADNTPTGTGTATATDNCAPTGNIVITSSDVSTYSADPANILHYNYVITRTWRATDVAGNFSTCDQTITVQDITKPAIVCPANVTISCEADNTPTGTGTATATDNCAPTGNIVITSSDVSTYSADPANILHYNYVITRTWRATDVAGNFSTCDQTITVQDITKPAIVCPANVTISCEADNTPTGTGTATATDNCAPTGNIVITSSDVSTYSADPANILHYNYVITRTWRATDVAGNFSTCDQTITVQDITKPAIVCPANVTISCEADNTPTGTGTATATDNCAPTGNIVITSSDVSTYSADPANILHYNYVITRTWRATDVAGNFSTCDQTITVQDITKPAIVCPANVTISCEADNTPTGTGTATATDNCAPTGNIVITSSDVSTYSADPANILHYNYVITRTWRATDVAGNFSTCDQTITVQDITKPAIVCPANVTISCEADNTPTGTGTATATDNCAPTGNIVITSSDVSTYSADPANILHYNYVITRTWRATDVAGNFSTCDQTITVRDITAPTFTVPATKTICRESNCIYNIDASITGDVTDESDNCTPGSLLNATYTDDFTGLVNCDSFGFVLRTWTLTDVTGNSTVKVQTIWIEPTPRATIVTTTPTVCNGSNINVTINSPTVSITSTNLSYIVTVSSTDTPNLGGTAAVGFTLVKADLPFSITGTLTNSSDAPIVVTYTVTPKLIGCSDGPVQTVTVTVNPTPQVVPSTLSQIICDDGTTSIILRSPSVFSNGVITFNYTVVATGGVTGFTTPVIGLQLNHVISDVLNNPTNEPQTVTYTIVPISPSGCPSGPPKVVVITVEPTPQIVPSTLAQTICNDARTDVILNSPTIVTGGVITFNYTVVATGGVTGFTTPLNGLPNGHKIEDLLHNPTNSFQTVTYTIVPITPICTNDPIQTIVITVNPTPQVTPSTLTQTICNNLPTNVILNSPSIFSNGPISFKYTAVATGGVTGFVPALSGLNNAHPIIDVLNNPGDSFQAVTYSITPLSPTGCPDGPIKDVKVTVNPTPRVIPLVSQICFGGTTSILLISPTTMTQPNVIKFDYNITATAPPAIVGGPRVPATDVPYGSVLAYPYTNKSDILQSVYYNVTPTAVGLCPSGIPQPFEVVVHPKPLQQLFLSKPLLCNGASDAILTANLSKGSKPDSIIWSGNFGSGDRFITTANSVDIVNLRTSWYFVTVKDIFGCRYDSAVFISGAVLDSYFQPINKIVNGFGTTCPESNDGELLLQENSSSTGIAPFTYTILNNGIPVRTGILAGKNIPRIESNLPPGHYTLLMTDANGCQNEGSQEADITAPDVISMEFNKKVYPGGFNITCKNEDDGSVEAVNIQGGNGGYTYQWVAASGLPLTVPSNTTRLDNVPAGKYYLYTTDRLGCQVKKDSVTLIEPDGMTLQSSEVSESPDGNSNISCNGGNDGFIKLNVSGGSGNYTYSWTGPNPPYPGTKDIIGLTAGFYECTIRDQTGCILLLPGSILPGFTLTEPAPLAVSYTASTSIDGLHNINCNGGTGSVLISVTGGSTGNYTYTWSTTNGSGIVQGQRDQNSLTAGLYKLIVKDLNNCETSVDITLTQPALLVNDLVPTHISCFPTSLDNGSINLTTSGGIAPYSYLWSNGATTEDLFNLTEGNYWVTVTDRNGCIRTDTVRINLPQPLVYTKVLSDYNGYNISCYGYSNGQININPQSGTPPFVFSWTGPNGFNAVTKDISGLTAGRYTLTITDVNLCSATEVFDLTEPGMLGINIDLSSSTAGGYNINCYGEKTGYINIEPLNYVNTIDYLWSDGIFGKTRTDLPAGEYNVIIIDANKCSANSTITLTEPDSMTLTFEVIQPFCPDKPDGEITSIVTGGVPGSDYLYKWSDNSTGRNLTNIPEGFYELEVTDLNGCSVYNSVKVDPVNETCLIIPNAISPNGDLINDIWNIGLVELYPEIEIKVFNRWGEPVWRSEKGYPQPWDGNSNGENLPMDSYHYIIDLHNGTKPIIGTITIVR